MYYKYRIPYINADKNRSALSLRQPWLRGANPPPVLLTCRLSCTSSPASSHLRPPHLQALIYGQHGAP